MVKRGGGGGFAQSSKNWFHHYLRTGAQNLPLQFTLLE